MFILPRVVHLDTMAIMADKATGLQHLFILPRVESLDTMAIVASNMSFITTGSSQLIYPA